MKRMIARKEKPMKKLLIAMVAAVLTIGTAYCEGTVTTEAYVNIPGEKAVHVMVARVTFLEGGVVRVETPWGVTYTTHLANVVIVARENRATVKESRGRK